MLSLPAALNTILSRTHKVATRRGSKTARQLAIFGIAVGVFKRERERGGKRARGNVVLAAIRANWLGARSICLAN